ncbi:MAG TPA: hypothetical protein VMK16_12975 [Acidimicrobiales bacterium]|nr:hypothetical protein [Acidimicrobiales bacterium]
MTGPVDDVLEQIVEDYLSRRTSYVRDRAYALAYAVHYDVTVQVDATAGDPEVLIEQRGIIPVAMTDLEDIEDEAWREQCREIEEELCPDGFPEVELWKANHPLGFQPPEWVDGQLVFRYNARSIALCTLALDDDEFERYVNALFRWLGKARELWIEQVTSGLYGGLDVITRFVDPDAYEVLTSAHPHLKPGEIFGA